MRIIVYYLKQYFYEVNKTILGLCTLFTALYIFLNYDYKIDFTITETYSFKESFFSRFVIFFLAFSIPYLIAALIRGYTYFSNKIFCFFLLLGPAIYSFKTAVNPSFLFPNDDRVNIYWRYISYWPFLVLITSAILFIVWKIFDLNQPFYGIKTKDINWSPYWLMLLIMLPLIAAASTQQDFLNVYPKMKLIRNLGELKNFSIWQKLLFEVSYGSDFITIELFFRGFLVLGFIKWAGKDAILPMAVFYCTIHFGKPLGECISSYFGGLILGIIVYNTRSILGGLIAHLGIAWMMEIGGHIGNQLFNPLY